MVVVTSRLPPHEMYLLAVSVLLGVGYLTHTPAPQSLAASVPYWVVLAWSFGLALSGAIGLAACLWRGDVLLSLGVERGALVMNTAAMMLLGSAFLAVNGVSLSWGIGTIVGWVLANIHRCIQITKDLRQIRVACKENTDG